MPKRSRKAGEALKRVKRALDIVIAAKEIAEGIQWRELHRIESGLVRLMGRTPSDSSTNRRLTVAKLQELLARAMKRRAGRKKKKAGEPAVSGGQ